MGHDPVIASHNLSFHFGHGTLRKQILFDLNLEVYPGEVVLLMGPSGSGKTTLLTLIGALRSIQSGRLKVLGQELLKANIHQQIWVRRQIGYIFQGHNLLKSLTARQNVQMSAELVNAPQASSQAAAMLAAVGLADHVDYLPAKLSGGQKQRVAIARALVHQPRLILADEPTAALDRQSGRDVVELMQKLAKEQGCTVFLVTHDGRIMDIADRILKMEDGRLLDET